MAAERTAPFLGLGASAEQKLKAVRAGRTVVFRFSAINGMLVSSSIVLIIISVSGPPLGAAIPAALAGVIAFAVSCRVRVAVSRQHIAVHNLRSSYSVPLHQGTTSRLRLGKDRLWLSPDGSEGWVSATAVDARQHGRNFGIPVRWRRFVRVLTGVVQDAGAELHCETSATDEP